jgi:hypothetical protein
VPTVVRFDLPARVRPHPSGSHLHAGHGLGGFAHHLGSLVLHAAIWGAVFRLFHRAPPLLWIILAVVLVAVMVRGINRAVQARWRRRVARITGRRW